jgi:hypothetical protein
MITSIKNDILVINFKGDRKKMNELLDPLSNKYEGHILNRTGHNFPSEYITKNHKLFQYRSKCKYVIGIYRIADLAHEILHAKFYLDINYKNKIELEWKELNIDKREYITCFLKKLGYSDRVIIDEYQAYRYSESNNFFGIKI